jgi:hypothetical protein
MESLVMMLIDLACSRAGWCVGGKKRRNEKSLGHLEAWSVFLYSHSMLVPYLSLPLEAILVRYSIPEIRQELGFPFCSELNLPLFLIHYIHLTASFLIPTLDHLISSIRNITPYLSV